MIHSIVSGGEKIQLQEPFPLILVKLNITWFWQNQLVKGSVCVGGVSEEWGVKLLILPVVSLKMDPIVFQILFLKLMSKKLSHMSLALLPVGNLSNSWRQKEIRVLRWISAWGSEAIYPTYLSRANMFVWRVMTSADGNALFSLCSCWKSGAWVLCEDSGHKSRQVSVPQSPCSLEGVSLVSPGLVHMDQPDGSRLSHLQIPSPALWAGAPLWVLCVPLSFLS